VKLTLDRAARVLPLRIGALTPERSETRDAHGRHPPAMNVGHPGGRNGEVVLANRERVLSGLGLREPESRIHNLVGAEKMRVAERNLLVQDADRAVRLAVQRERMWGG